MNEPGRFPKLQKMESVRGGNRWHAPSEKHWKRQGYDSAEHCREHKIALGWEPFSENKKTMWKNTRGEYATAEPSLAGRQQYSSTKSTQDSMIKQRLRSYEYEDREMIKRHEKVPVNGMGEHITLDEAKDKVM